MYNLPLKLRTLFKQTIKIGGEIPTLSDWTKCFFPRVRKLFRLPSNH
jgi:hypothetical protein